MNVAWRARRWSGTYTHRLDFFYTSRYVKIPASVARVFLFLGSKIAVVEIWVCHCRGRQACLQGWGHVTKFKFKFHSKAPCLILMPLFVASSVFSLSSWCAFSFSIWSQPPVQEFTSSNFKSPAQMSVTNVLGWLLSDNPCRQNLLKTSRTRSWTNQEGFKIKYVI